MGYNETGKSRAFFLVFCPLAHLARLCSSRLHVFKGAFLSLLAISDTNNIARLVVGDEETTVRADRDSRGPADVRRTRLRPVAGDERATLNVRGGPVHRNR